MITIPFLFYPITKNNFDPKSIQKIISHIAELRKLLEGDTEKFSETDSVWSFYAIFTRVRSI